MIALIREPSGRRASTIGDGFIDTPSDLRNDPIDDQHQMLVVLELTSVRFSLPQPLDVDLDGRR